MLLNNEILKSIVGIHVAFEQWSSMNGHDDFLKVRNMKLICISEEFITETSKTYFNPYVKRFFYLNYSMHMVLKLFIKHPKKAVNNFW